MKLNEFKKVLRKLDEIRKIMEDGDQENPQDEYVRRQAEYKKAGVQQGQLGVYTGGINQTAQQRQIGNYAPKPAAPAAQAPQQVTPVAAPTQQAPQRQPQQRNQTFGQAFAAARKQGLQTFTWRGKLYNTKLKGEGGGSMNNTQQAPAKASLDPDTTTY